MAKEIKAIVANRRSVDVGGKIYGPGETVTLSADEVKKLREIGFLADPDSLEITASDGPTFGSEDGPGVKTE